MEQRVIINKFLPLSMLLYVVLCDFSQSQLASNQLFINDTKNETISNQENSDIKELDALIQRLNLSKNLPNRAELVKSVSKGLNEKWKQVQRLTSRSKHLSGLIEEAVALREELAAIKEQESLSDETSDVPHEKREATTVVSDTEMVVSDTEVIVRDAKAAVSHTDASVSSGYAVVSRIGSVFDAIALGQWSFYDRNSLPWNELVDATFLGDFMPSMWVNSDRRVKETLAIAGKIIERLSHHITQVLFWQDFC